MGQSGSRQSEVHVLLLGLDNAGKSTLLYKLKHNLCVGTVPTIGFNVEMLEARKKGKNMALTLWDVGGQSSMRQHWKSFHHNTAAVVFVVDSSDRARVEEARRALEDTLRSAELRARPVIVLANKQDASGAMTATEIKDELRLKRMCSDRDWFVQPCSASTGFGLEEALRRLVQVLKAPSDSAAMRDNIRETVRLIRASTARH